MSFDAPQNKIYTVVGATGSGKTPFIIGGDFEEGLAKIFQRKNMSTLVLDEIDHVKYRERGVQIIQPSEYLDKLNNQINIYRTLCPFQYFRKLLEEIAYNKLVWNTLLVLEDSSKYIPHHFTNLEKTLIGNSKQQNVDIVFMYWNWGQIPPDVLRMSKYFVIFKTSDSPESRESYIKGCFNDCMDAYRGVMKGKAPYYTVDTGI